MDNKAGTHVSWEVFHEDVDEPLTVCGGDIPGYVRIAAIKELHREYWGPIEFTIPASMARELAAALIASAAEEEKAKA